MFLLLGDSDEVCGVVSAVVKADLESVVSQASLTDWRQAVVTVITHSSDKEQLGQLLRKSFIISNVPGPLS